MDRSRGLARRCLGRRLSRWLEPVAGEAVVSHTRNSGFHNSTLQEVLLALEVRDIICCGVSTAYAV
ncbi:MAG: isochorismatase family protein [Minwuia sp.]|nr:isochorismatase family protein [Minwuia sp.]